MKVSVSLGATLSLGNYNTARASITFEEEYSDTDITVLIESAVDENNLDRSDIINIEADKLYQEVENKLIEKIAQFITRLEEEKMV
jgi:hypothetical protein